MSRLSRHLLAMTLCALMFTFLRPAPTVAQGGLAELCPFLLHERQTELEDLELAVQQEETRLQVAEEIFTLLDGLWRNEIVERLPYLAVKHNRDVAVLDLQRARRRLGRQQAVVEQFRLVCSAPSGSEQTEDDRRALEEAYQRYLDADCRIRVLDVATFEVDREYQQEVLRSARDLRQNDVASRQQVLFAERDVQLTLERLEQAMQRVGRCQEYRP